MEQSLVDRAIERAQLEAKATETRRYEVQLPKGVLDKAHGVCERNGITLAAFFRAAAAQLVEDYGA